MEGLGNSTGHHAPAGLRGPAAFAIACTLVALVAMGAGADDEESAGDTVGYPVFLSPHARPLAVDGGFLYVANTAAGTLDVIDTASRSVVASISTGVEPVSVAVRPDGNEVWVANHVSDSVSVIDTDADSDTYRQVVATVQDVDPDTFATRFDEPVGIAFANDDKAYVALSPSNRVAIVDVATRSVTGHLDIRAQDPRAIAVRGERLYVIPFESNNQSQLSGCVASGIDGDTCTFNAVEHVFTNNNVLSTGYDADIVTHERVPDRDLFVYDTETDTLVATVTGLGTLLYGLAVDSEGTVFVAQADARNVANGRAGTQGHGLDEMENRAFLNQITRVPCTDAACGSPERFDLEPLPPEHPAEGMALATPFGIRVSDDDSTLVATAAGSDRLFTVDAETGDVLGRVAVGAVPRGIALVSDSEGAPSEAWVLNTVSNTVSLVDVGTVSAPTVTATIQLDDPTDPGLRQGRIAFNDADASSTGTFSCESCHPDGHTDQLLWVLATPECDVEGCTQIPPRLTMPVRGLRGTAPYHWDGIPGDPFGGRNTSSINADVEPNCELDDPESCTRFLVDGTIANTMCDQADCPTNDEGKAGLLDAEDRDALARFILSIPYPPAPERPADNVLTDAGVRGFFEFSFVNDSDDTTGAQTCGSCHRPPFLVSTNTPGTGMDAPTWRGAYDRWMMLPQGRLNIVDLMTIVRMDDTFPERDMWILAGASSDIWQMVRQGSTGFHGAFARQLTLNADTARDATTVRLMNVLEQAASDGGIVLRGEGAVLRPQGAAADTPSTVKPVVMEYRNGRYEAVEGRGVWGSHRLRQRAGNGEMVVTLTGRAGAGVDVDFRQPALWQASAIEAQTRNVDIPFLTDTSTLRISARHVEEDASVFVDGRRTDARVRCEAGTLPDCDDEIAIVEFTDDPEPGGLHFLQVQNPAGLFSNDLMFFSEQSDPPARSGNLIMSGGAFTAGQFANNWNKVELVGSVDEVAGTVRAQVDNAHDDPWRVQLSHAVLVTAGQEYTLCYRARAQGVRFMTAYVDTNLDDWRNLSGGQHRADLTFNFQSFSHTFTVTETDLKARVAFDFAQSALDVWIDDIGLYEGDSCGTP